MKIHDLYKQVTDSIVRDLEAGAPTWLKPWKDGKTSGLMPQNAATGRPYSGINICLLWGARDEHGWPTSAYMTFRQALAKGAGVRKGEKGTQRYAAEELIAEMTSAFLCAHLGITGELRHAGYIGNWLTLLKSDDRAIFTAAAKARRAADYLRSFSEQIEDDEQEAA